MECLALGICSLPRLWHSMCYHIAFPQIHSEPQYYLKYIPPIWQNKNLLLSYGNQVGKHLSFYYFE